jgi:hypothetical protein
MPKSNKSKYTEEEYQKDLTSLESMINMNEHKGGVHDYHEDDEDSMEGGKKEKKEYTGSYRHFKLVKVDGKAYTSGSRADIKEHHTPLYAARKLLTSMVKKDNLSDNAKSKLKVVFTIQETTRHSQKEFGPYVGTYYKYTPSEAAKAKTADGKVSFKFKPIVKLHKGNKENKEQKGGKQL